MRFILGISIEARNLKSETGLHAATFRFLTAFGMTKGGSSRVTRGESFEMMRESHSVTAGESLGMMQEDL